MYRTLTHAGRDAGRVWLRHAGTPGKSGSLFFFSHDMKFIVKTLPKREAKLLLEILPNYFQHVNQNPGPALLPFLSLPPPTSRDLPCNRARLLPCFDGFDALTRPL